LWLIVNAIRAFLLTGELLEFFKALKWALIGLLFLSGVRVLKGSLNPLWPILFSSTLGVLCALFTAGAIWTFIEQDPAGVMLNLLKFTENKENKESIHPIVISLTLTCVSMYLVQLFLGFVLFLAFRLWIHFVILTLCFAAVMTNLVLSGSIVFGITMLVFYVGMILDINFHWVQWVRQWMQS